MLAWNSATVLQWWQGAVYDIVCIKYFVVWSRLCCPNGHLISIQKSMWHQNPTFNIKLMSNWCHVPAGTVWVPLYGMLWYDMDGWYDIEWRGMMICSYTIGGVLFAPPILQMIESISFSLYSPLKPVYHHNNCYICGTITTYYCFNQILSTLQMIEMNQFFNQDPHFHSSPCFQSRPAWRPTPMAAWRQRSTPTLAPCRLAWCPPRSYPALPYCSPATPASPSRSPPQHRN